MPDVISDVHSMNLSNMEDFMDEERHSVSGDPMLSHHLLHSPHSEANSVHNLNMNHNNQHLNHQLSNQLNNNMLGLDAAHMGDPMFSGSSNQHSTVDMSCIDPIIANYTLLTNAQRSNSDNSGVVDSILQSDTDSLVSDIDMVA